jgi:putative addiction module component (TIGR02574 family)
MSPTFQRLGLDRLSVEERIALAEELWESAEHEIERAPLTEAQRKELERRLADCEANPNAVIPWEQIKAEALARFRK